jgi:hypothetical protein
VKKGLLERIVTDPPLGGLQDRVVRESILETGGQRNTDAARSLPRVISSQPLAPPEY